MGSKIGALSRQQESPEPRQTQEEDSAESASPLAVVTIRGRRTSVTKIGEETRKAVQQQGQSSTKKMRRPGARALKGSSSAKAAALSADEAQAIHSSALELLLMPSAEEWTGARTARRMLYTNYCVRECPVGLMRSQGCEGIS